MPLVYDIELEKLRIFIRDKKVCITVDETTDECGRSVVNILFSFDKLTKLVKTEFLTEVNFSTISQLVVSTISFYNLPFENIILYISDNASYMKKSFSDILSPLIPQMRHNTCFAHIYNLVGNTWLEYDKFQIIDNIVTAIKSTFTYSAPRKRRWLKHLSSHVLNEDIRLTLPPSPVRTRWFSWFRFIIWMKPYLKYLITFYQEESKLPDPSKAIINLASWFSNPDTVILIELITMFITFNGKQ